jgi:hypothetical protein
MGLDFESAVVSKSVGWLSLDHFVDKVCCFNAPTPWHFSFFDLDLLG